MEAVQQIVTWSLFSMLGIGMVEYTIHRWMQHKSFLALRGTYRRHAVEHHGEGRNDVNVDQPVWFSLLLASPIAVGLWQLSCTTHTVPPLAVPTFLVMVAIHARTWTKLHRSFHDLETNWTERLWCYHSLRYNHMEHHRRPNRNFGTLFGLYVDSLMRTRSHG